MIVQNGSPKGFIHAIDTVDHQSLISAACFISFAIEHFWLHLDSLLDPLFVALCHKLAKQHIARGLCHSEKQLCQRSKDWTATDRHVTVINYIICYISHLGCIASLCSSGSRRDPQHLYLALLSKVTDESLLSLILKSTQCPLVSLWPWVC